jgi:hypothetical protein
MARQAFRRILAALGPSDHGIVPLAHCPMLLAGWPQSARQDVRPMRDPEPQGQLRVGGDLIAHVAHVAVRP